jgi:hypothetical protein
MKRLIIILLLFAATKVAGQTIGYLRFDTVMITKAGGTAELVLLNKTKDTVGILANPNGNGRTRFMRSRAINDSTIVVGPDTLVLKGYNTNTGTGYRWATDGSNEIKTFTPSFGLLLDSTINNGSITGQVDSFSVLTRGYGQYKIDSLAAELAGGGGAVDSLHIYTASDPDPDSLYQYIGGDSSLVGYIPKAESISITNTRVAFGDGSNKITDDADFTFNSTSKRLTVGNTTIGSGTPGSNRVELGTRTDGVRTVPTISLYNPHAPENYRRWDIGVGNEWYGGIFDSIFSISLRNDAGTTVGIPFAMNRSADSINLITMITSKLRLYGNLEVTRAAQFGGPIRIDSMATGSSGDSVVVTASDGTLKKVAQSDIAGGGGGISKVIADFGLVNVNDSTVAADSTVMVQWPRLYKVVDSSIAALRQNINDSLNEFKIEAIVANAGDSGVSLGYASNDTFYVKKLNVVGGTIATNADSSVTITVTGGGGGGTPGGSDTQIQYNDDGAFAGTSGMTWDNSNAGLTITKDNLGITRNLSSGLRLSNTQAASSGNQQISPPIILRGNQWNTTAGASHAAEWIMDLDPRESSTNLGVFRMAFRGNEGTTSEVFTFSSTGALTTSGLIQGGGFTNGSTGIFRWSSRATIASPADGVIRLSNSTFTDFTRLCFGGTTTSFPALGRSSTNLQAVLGDGSALTDLEVADETYGSGWNGSNEVPTKNAVYDKIESLGSGSSPYIYQFISTQQVTVSNTTTETTIYGTGEGSAGIDGSSNITTGTQIVLKGAGEINTDASSAPTLQLNFKTPTSTVTFNISDLATGLNQSPYTYEYKLIPLGTGTSQSYIWQFDFYCENNFNPIVYKFGGRETSALTTTGTVTIDVTVEWSAADDDNTLVANYNTIEIFKK